MLIKDSLQQQIHFMATSMVTNVVVVMKLHCVSLYVYLNYFRIYTQNRIYYGELTGYVIIMKT